MRHSLRNRVPYIILQQDVHASDSGGHHAQLALARSILLDLTHQDLGALD